MSKLEAFISPPGTGKTTACIDLFREEILKSKNGILNRSYFVLPSREHAERIQHLILKSESPGFFNAHILSINDLAPRLLGGIDRMRPTDTIRRSVIRRILSGVSASGAQFSYFESVKDFSGFHELLADAVKELRSSLLTLEDFEKRAQRLLGGAGFREKFKDFTILLKNYDIEMSRLGLQEPEEDVEQLKQAMELVENPALVILDGFYHFTRAQQRLIEVLATMNTHLVVTLTIPDRQEQTHLFEYLDRTRSFLKRLQFEVIREPFQECRRTAVPELLHVEKNIFCSYPDIFMGKPDAITLIEASNLRVEAEMIAREIRRHYREGTGHYSDTCIILRSIEPYEKIFRATLKEYGIPFYLHERHRLIENGLIALLHRFFRVIREGWRHDDLMQVLKSGFFRSRVSRESVLAFEAVAYRENISDGRQNWMHWAQLHADEPVIGLLRFLEEMETSVLQSGSIRAFSHQMDVFFKELDCSYGVMKEDRAEEDRHAIGCLKSILQGARRYHDTGSAGSFSAENFISEFMESIERGLFSLVPTGKNHVQIYDAIMSLPKEFKVVFIAGLLEKSFPRAVSEDPLFKDRERRIMNGGDPVLEERLWRMGGERYFFYMSVSRAKEKLYLTYPAYDSDGRANLPSFFIHELTRCFQADSIRRLRKQPDEFLPLLEEIESPLDADRVLGAELYTASAQRYLPTQKMSALYAERMRGSDFGKILDEAMRVPALVLSDPKILQDMGLAERVYSATRLETFVTCAFKFFAGRSLGLKEPLEGREEMEMGSLMHNTLEDFYRGLSAKEKSPEHYLADRASTKVVLQEILDKKMEKSIFRNELVYRRRIHLNSMREALSLYVDREADLSLGRRLIPSYFEVSFGKESGGEFPHLILTSGGAPIRLTGKMDRVDVDADGKKALVIDYKRSKRKMREKLGQGLELQLPIYLMALKKLMKVEPMGAELRILVDGTKEGLYLEEDAERLGASKAQIVTPKEMDAILSRAEGQIRSAVERIENGEIAVRPKSCKFCDFDPVCRFEKWKLAYVQT